MRVLFKPIAHTSWLVISIFMSRFSLVVDSPLGQIHWRCKHLGYRLELFGDIPEDLNGVREKKEL